MITNLNLLDKILKEDCILDPRSGYMILLDEEKEIIKDGIYIPNLKNTSTYRAGNLASGVIIKKANEESLKENLNIKTRVLFKSSQGLRLTFQDYTLHFLDEKDILAIITDYNTNIN